MKLSTLLVPFLLLTTTAYAGQIFNARVTEVRVDRSGYGYVRFDRDIEALASCANQHLRHLSFDLNTPSGASLLNLALSAHGTKAKINAWGTGTCEEWNGAVESWSHGWQVTSCANDSETCNSPELTVKWQPAIVTQGQSADLHVTAYHVSYCRGDSGVKKGTQWVSQGVLEPADRTVSISCFDDSDNEVITRTATLTVKQAPALSVSWQPSSIIYGESSQVHVNANHVNYCRGDSGVKKGTSWISAPEFLRQNRTVTIRCYDDLDREVIAKQATLTVKQPSLSVYWQPSRVKQGDGSRVNVSAQNVSHCRGDSGVAKGTSWISPLVYELATRTVTIKCYDKQDVEVISRRATLEVIQ